MNGAFAQILLLVVKTGFSIFIFCTLLRFLLQLVRADFYNPLSQSIVKITDPLLMPLRKIIPGFGGVDIAALVLALIMQVIMMGLIMTIAGFGVPLINLVIWGPIGLTLQLLDIFFYCIMIMVILSWIAPGQQNPVSLLVNQILAPLLTPIRNKMPDMGGLDLTPMVLILLIMIGEILIKQGIGASTGYPF